MKVFNIASIPGDGVGKEVVPAAQRVLKAVSDVHGDSHFGLRSFHTAVSIIWNTGK